MKVRKILSSLSLICFIALIGMLCAANAVTLDFEDMPDLTNVGNFYASYGVRFANAISLTAGFSLNEFDYPPSSGDIAIGDDYAPIIISFENPAENIFANFTYGSQLTFTAYDGSGSVIGSYINPGRFNYGGTELISLGFTSVSSLRIAGEWDGSFIMDDFHFDFASASAVPEPGTLALLGIGLIGCVVNFRKK